MALSEIQYHYLFGVVSKDQQDQINSAKYDFDHFMNVFHVRKNHMQNYMKDIQQRIEVFD
jgi:hypothetical protein